MTEEEAHLLQRELPHELLARRFEIPGGQILVWLGTDLMYGGVDVLDQEGTMRGSWEDEVDSEEDLIALMTDAGIAMKDAREIGPRAIRRQEKVGRGAKGQAVVAMGAELSCGCSDGRRNPRPVRRLRAGRSHRQSLLAVELNQHCSPSYAPDSIPRPVTVRIEAGAL